MDHQEEVLKFGEEISALVDKHKDIIPLTAMAKVLATIQVDLMAIHAAIQVAAHLAKSAEGHLKPWDGGPLTPAPSAENEPAPE